MIRLNLSTDLVDDAVAEDERDVGLATEAFEKVNHREELTVVAERVIGVELESGERLEELPSAGAGAKITFMRGGS
jgi:hypothetical protein